jgi:hypothetical protein
MTKIKNDLSKRIEKENLLLDNEILKLLQLMITPINDRKNSEEVLSFIHSSEFFKIELNREFNIDDIKNQQTNFDKHFHNCNEGELLIDIIKGIINLTSDNMKKFCCSINIRNFNYKTELKNSLTPTWKEKTIYVKPILMKDINELEMTISLFMEKEIIGIGKLDLIKINYHTNGIQWYNFTLLILSTCLIFRFTFPFTHTYNVY